ncbi:MAG: type VI secretion system contractile sheath large subunit [Planctomycetia bacterium]
MALSVLPVQGDALGRRLQQTLARLIAQIDLAITAQINEVLHHGDFQRMEASWRGLHFLWRTAAEVRQQAAVQGEQTGIEIRVLSVRRRELLKDFESAAEFDQSELFRKVYESEFGQAGGTPYGLLVADYEFSEHPADLDLLEYLAGVAAAAFAPLIAAASPNLLGLESFAQLDRTVGLKSITSGRRSRKWSQFRSHPDSRFVGLTLPRILLRTSFPDDGSGRFGFRFSECSNQLDRSRLLWGSAAWAFAAVVCRTFAATAWFADIRGMQRGRISGGLVSGLPNGSFRIDPQGTVERGCVEVHIPDRRESELSELGFVPLCHCRETSTAVFYSASSVHAPGSFTSDLASASARLSAMLQYVLCCSRIAHYLKVRVRDLTGAGENAQEISRRLNEWVQSYVTPDDRATPDMKARFPLREASVEIEELPDRPGSYHMKMRLQPHYQLDQLDSSMTFVATRVRIIS